MTLLECNTETTLVISDISSMSEEELREAELNPIPKDSQRSLDLLLNDDISNLEVIIQKWTCPEEFDDVDEDEELNHIYDNSDDECRNRETEISLLLRSKMLEKKSNSAPVEYINLQKELNSSPASVTVSTAEAVMEKEKMFLEEDEDAR